MINVLNDVFSSRGEQFRILPISCIEKLRRDIDDIIHGELSTDFARKAAKFASRFKLPQPGFDIASVIVAASPSPVVRIHFNLKGQRVPIIMPPTYMEMTSKFKEIESALNNALTPKGFHVIAEERLPQKMLAVRSGLTLYGRNNVSYVEGLGSFVRLSTFLSDIPCEETTWQDFKQMASCQGCTLCLDSCPTKAIKSDHYLVDASKCLTRENERQGDFPAWISASMHNAIIGCMRCQEVCPHNKKALNNIIEPVEFTEEETLYILDSKPLDSAPLEFLAKLKALGIDACYEVIPRNLKALFNKQDA